MRALHELPTSLDETYERLLKEITTTNQHHAYRLLLCLTVARRPLRVEELAELLALDFDGTEAEIPELKEEWRWKDQQEAVLSTCPSLISIVDSGLHRMVHFSHFSVNEFLTSDRLASSADVSHFRIFLEPAHNVIVKACLGILHRSDNEVGDSDAKNRSPLREYAARYWVDHVQFEKVSRTVEDGMRRLFDLAEPHFTSWLKTYDIDVGWDNYADNSKIPHGSPLYYASLCGFCDLAAYLADVHPHLVNARGGRNYNPMVAALHRRHLNTAELLYQRGADVDIRGTCKRTPLHAASTEGSIDIAQWLLARGADANSQDNNGDVPLHLAAKNGHFEFVRMLLTFGVTVDSKNKDNRTSLHVASEGRHAKIVRLLLEFGADVAAQDRIHRTPLHLALSWVSVNIALLYRITGLM